MIYVFVEFIDDIYWINVCFIKIASREIILFNINRRFGFHTST